MPFPITESLKKTIISHFKRKGLEWNEEYFIKHLSSEKKYDVYWSVLALRDCGTNSCVPYLKNLISYPMQDVKCTSILTIAHIAKDSETQFYCDCLLSSIYREKGYAMWAISDAANENAVEHVLQYFNKNKSKIKNGKLANGTLVDGCQYLSKYIDNPPVREFFEFVMASFGNLSAGEKSELIKRVSYFHAMA